MPNSVQIELILLKNEDLKLESFFEKFFNVEYCELSTSYVDIVIKISRLYTLIFIIFNTKV